MHDFELVGEREIDLLTQLLALLGEEQDLLKRAQAAELAAIGVKKQAIIDNLNTLEAARGKQLGCVNSQGIRAAAEKWLAGRPNDRLNAARWTKLLGLARQAKHLHDLNARLVNLHLQQTNELLSALTSQPQKNALYGSKGQAFASSGSRIVDSA